MTEKRYLPRLVQLAARLYEGTWAVRAGRADTFENVRIPLPCQSDVRIYNAILARVRGCGEKPRDQLPAVREIVVAEIANLRGNWEKPLVNSTPWIPEFLAKRAALNDWEFFEKLGDAIKVERKPAFSPLQMILLENWDQWHPACSAEMGTIPPLKHFTRSAAVALLYLKNGEEIDEDAYSKTINHLGLSLETPAKVTGVREKSGGRIVINMP